jgi:hypothetical protein
MRHKIHHQGAIELTMGRILGAFQKFAVHIDVITAVIESID